MWSGNGKRKMHFVILAYTISLPAPPPVSVIAVSATHLLSHPQGNKYNFLHMQIDKSPSPSTCDTISQLHVQWLNSILQCARYTRHQKLASYDSPSLARLWCLLNLITSNLLEANLNHLHLAAFVAFKLIIFAHGTELYSHKLEFNWNFPGTLSQPTQCWFIADVPPPESCSSMSPFKRRSRPEIEEESA